MCHQQVCRTLGMDDKYGFPQLVPSDTSQFWHRGAAILSPRLKRLQGDRYRADAAAWIRRSSVDCTDISNMFLFEAYLGEGGNGEVHRVREVAPPNRAFACKQIPKAIRTSRNCADRRYRQPRIILLFTLRTKAMLFATAGASDYERMTRFDQIKSEIQTLYTVAGHESVIELHDVYEDANHWYLILDLCDGT